MVIAARLVFRGVCERTVLLKLIFAEYINRMFVVLAVDKKEVVIRLSHSWSIKKVIMENYNQQLQLCSDVHSCFHR